MSRSLNTRNRRLAAGMVFVAAAGALGIVGAGSASADLGTTPTTQAAFGTPKIDGVADAIWSHSPDIQLSSASSPITGDARLLWDRNYLYALVTVQDATPSDAVTSTGQPGNAGIGNDDDSVDFWINWQNSPFASYYNTSGDLATHYDITRNGIVATNYAAPFSSAQLSSVKSAVVSDDTHYVVEAAFPWPRSVGAQPKVGVNISANDDANGDSKRDSFIVWQPGPAGDTEVYQSSPFDLPAVTLQGATPAGFTAQYVTASRVSRGATVHFSVANLWAGQQPAFTKVWGDGWLSVSPSGIVTGRVPSSAGTSAAITVAGSNDSSITVTVPISG